MTRLAARPDHERVASVKHDGRRGEGRVLTQSEQHDAETSGMQQEMGNETRQAERKGTRERRKPRADAVLWHQSSCGTGSRKRGRCLELSQKSADSKEGPPVTSSFGRPMEGPFEKDRQAAEEDV